MALLTLPDGRTIELTDTGAPSGAAGRVLVYHHGTPGVALVPSVLLEAATEAGWRVVAASRPGYGASTPHPGRRVADAAADTAAALDHLGIGECVAVGWSGGGPHALACAALLPGRVRAVATLAGLAPSDADGLDWPAGMGDDNLQEFALARQGARALHDGLTMGAAELRHVDAAGLVDAMGSLLPDADRAALSGAASGSSGGSGSSGASGSGGGSGSGGAASGVAQELAALLSLGVANGVAGWVDDDLAFVSPWGFDPADVAATGARVGLWQGSDDLMVPAAHGHWLGAHIPGSTLHALAGEGHLSLLAHAPDVVAFLAG